MKIWQRITPIIAVMLLLVSCSSSQVSGNGKSVTKSRQVNSFNEIKISGAYKVVITQGNIQSVKVTTDSNIEPLVITDVKGDTLRIHNKKGVGFSLSRPVLVQIAVRKLKRLMVSGANQIIASNLNGDKLQVDTNGSIQGSFTGKVSKLNVQVSGSGKIDASKLVAEDVRVRLTGSGQIKVNATDSLNSRITGSGTIMYSGNPNDVDQTIVGSGKLERMK